MRSASSEVSRKKVSNKKEYDDYDSDFSNYKDEDANSTHNKKSTNKPNYSPTETPDKKMRKARSNSEVNSKYRSPSESRSRSNSYKSRTPSPAYSPVNNSKPTKQINGNSKLATKYKSHDNLASNNSYKNNKGSDSKPSRHSDVYPVRRAANARPGVKQQTNRRGQRTAATLPPTESLSQVAQRVMSAQRIKNTDLQNKVNELRMELEKAREENKTLRRVQQREEVALKRLESNDVDIGRLIRNHGEEISALKEMLKKVKSENKKLNESLMDKDEEIRGLKKKRDDYKKILEDKKMLDSAELSKKLESAEKELQEYKTKCENQERRIEMLEKNHKHEIGVEMAHHREVQRQLQRLSEEHKELKVRLEEKERALDISNIYSRQNRDVTSLNNASWKQSSQSLNNVPQENAPPNSDRKQNISKRKDQKQAISNKSKTKEDLEPRGHKSSSVLEAELSKQRADVEQKHSELVDYSKKPVEAEAKRSKIEMDDRPPVAPAVQVSKQAEIDEEKHRIDKLRKLEEEKKRKEAADEERKRRELEEKEKEKEKEREKEREKRRVQDEEERRRKEKEKDLLEEEERKKRWTSSNQTLNQTEEKEKNSVEKSKKDELLAKLALLDDHEIKPTITTTTSKNNENQKNPQPTTEKTLTSNSSYNSIFNQTNNQSLNQAPVKASFGQTNKPLQANFGNNQIEHKFTPPVENLHEGKPANFPRDSSAPKENKNELLTKLFGDTKDSSSLNNYNKTQSKVSKVDDLFVSSNKPTLQNGTNSKGNLLPWEVQENKNSGKSQIANDDVNKNDYLDFFSKLNSNNNGKSGTGFGAANKTSVNNNGMNRPKMDNNNKLLFSSNQHKSNNFVEDIEELVL